MTAHIPIVGDIRLVLSELAAKVENNVSQDWIDRVFGLKAKYPPRGGRARTAWNRACLSATCPP